VLFDVAHESGAHGLERVDLTLDGLHLLTVVDHCRGSFEAVVPFTSRDHVSGLRSIVLTRLLVDTLALVAAMVDALLASKASHRLVRERTHLIVLLGREAGLRCGEMIALEWTDVDLVNRQLTVSRSDWNGQVTTPKGGPPRHVPLTKRLAAALSEHRHLRSTRVLCQDDTESLTRQIVQTRAKRAARRAGVMRGSTKSGGGGVHILRHTFCSHLAMRGAPARAIQELAGHADLSMTQRYMHLSPAALDAAIRLLEEPASPSRAAARPGPPEGGPHVRTGVY
jgi:integrase